VTALERWGQKEERLLGGRGVEKRGGCQEGGVEGRRERAGGGGRREGERCGAFRVLGRGGVK
jgi:hypothetical protein